MRLANFAFAIALVNSSATAHIRKDDTPQTLVSILVDGQPVKGKVVEIDGKHYMAVEDVAQSLGGTIAYHSGEIAVTFAQLPPTTLVPRKTGRIKGTLTYFFNDNFGHKPDTGARVWLVPGRIVVPADQMFIGTSGSLRSVTETDNYKPIAYSIADGNGNFELVDVPTGEYTLIVQSSHTNGPSQAEALILRTSITMRDVGRRFDSRFVQIKQGDTLVASHDFGHLFLTTCILY